MRSNEDSDDNNLKRPPSPNSPINNSSKVVKKTSQQKHGKWEEEQQKLFIQLLGIHGENNLSVIAEKIPSRSLSQVKSHAQKYLKKQKQSRRKEQLLRTGKQKIQQISVILTRSKAQGKSIPLKQKQYGKYKQEQHIKQKQSIKEEQDINNSPHVKIEQNSDNVIFFPIQNTNLLENQELVLVNPPFDRTVASGFCQPNSTIDPSIGSFSLQKSALVQAPGLNSPNSYKPKNHESESPKLKPKPGPEEYNQEQDEQIQ